MIGPPICPPCGRPVAPRRYQRMNFPDLAPWFDSPSDGYDELPTGEHEIPYDE